MKAGLLENKNKFLTARWWWTIGMSARRWTLGTGWIDIVGGGPVSLW